MDSTEEQKLLEKLPAKDKANFLRMKEKNPENYYAILKTLYGGQSRLRDITHLDIDKKTETADEASRRHFEESLKQPDETEDQYKYRQFIEEREEEANRELAQKQNRVNSKALDKKTRDLLNAQADKIDLVNTDKFASLAEQRNALDKLKSLIKQAREAKRAANKASKALYKSKGSQVFNDLFELDDKGRYHFKGDHDFFSVDDYMTVGRRKVTTAQELRDTGLYDDKLEGIAKEIKDSYKGKDVKPKEIAGEIRKVQNEFLKAEIKEMGKDPDATMPVYGVKNAIKKYLTGDINDSSMFKLATILDVLEEKKEAGILTPSEELFLLTMDNEKAKLGAEKAREDAIKEAAFMLNDKDTLNQLKEYGVHDFEGLVDLLSSSGGEEDLSDAHDAYLFANDLFNDSTLRRGFGKSLTEQLKDLKSQSQKLRDEAKKGLGTSDIKQVKDATGKNWWLVTASGGGKGNAAIMIHKEDRDDKKYLVGYTVTNDGNSGYSANTATKPIYMEEIKDGKSTEDMLNGFRRNLEENRWLAGNDMRQRQTIGKEAWDTQEMQKIAELVGKSLSEAEKLYTPSEIKRLALKGNLQISKKDGKFKCTREFARDYAETFGEDDVAHIPGLRAEKSDIGKNRAKTTTNRATIVTNSVDEGDPNIFSFKNWWHATQVQGARIRSNMLENQAENDNPNVTKEERDGQTYNKKRLKSDKKSTVLAKNGVRIEYNDNSLENKKLARDIGTEWFKSLSKKEQDAFTDELGMTKAYIATDAGKKAFINACAKRVFEDPELYKRFNAHKKGNVIQSGADKALLPDEKKDSAARKAQYEDYTANPNSALANRISARFNAQAAMDEQADIDAKHNANKTFNDEEYTGPTDEELYAELKRQINAGSDYVKAHNNLNEDTANKPRPKWAPKGSEGHAKAIANKEYAKKQAEKEKKEAEDTAWAHKQLNKETAKKRKDIVKKNKETTISSNILDAFEGL